MYYIYIYDDNGDYSLYSNFSYYDYGILYIDSDVYNIFDYSVCFIRGGKDILFLKYIDIYIIRVYVYNMFYYILWYNGLLFIYIKNILFIFLLPMNVFYEYVYNVFNMLFNELYKELNYIDIRLYR